MIKICLSLALVAVALASTAPAPQFWSRSYFDDKSFNKFGNVLQGWSVLGGNSNTNPTYITYCGAISIFGGYNAIQPSQRAVLKIGQIPVHKSLRIQVEVYFLDSWDGEYFNIYVDGQNVFQQKEIYGLHDQHLCGLGGWFDRIQRVDVKFNHVDPCAYIEISSTLDQGPTDESWGLRNFKISSSAYRARKLRKSLKLRK